MSAWGKELRRVASIEFFGSASYVRALNFTATCRKLLIIGKLA